MVKIRKLKLWAAKIILGIFLFYIIVCAVILPLAGPAIAKSQLKKLTGHELKLKLIILNPFTWKLAVKDLEIADSNGKAIAGFDDFWVDISFLSLIRKKYHIESIGLNGLQVNIVLEPDGSVNLMKLIPAKDVQVVEQGKAESEDKEAIVKPDENVKPADPVQSSPLPYVLIDLIRMERGKISVRDRSIDPEFKTNIDNIVLRLESLSTDPEIEGKISFKALIDDKATVLNEASIRPFANPLSMEMVFKLNNYFLEVLSPYVGKYTGRKAESGKLDVTVEYRIMDNKLDANHKVVVQSFDFGEKVESDNALKLPFGMVIALLEDSQERIKISLPVDGDISDPEFHYFHLVGQVAKDFFFKIITKPFSALVSMVGSSSTTEDYGYIRFSPGRSELLDEEKEKIRTIIEAFKQRPNIAIKIRRSYDSLADWRKIKSDVFEKDVNELKQETERPDVYVYERLYDRRFGMRAFWQLTNKYRLEDGGYDFDEIMHEVRQQLIEDGFPDKKALEALAAARAQAVYDYMIGLGFPVDRVGVSDIEDAQSISDFVPVSLEVKIYENSKQDEEDLPAVEQVSSLSRTE